LEPGPITLYAGGVFVGEGLLDKVEVGATQFVSYARDHRLTLSRDVRADVETAKLVKMAGGRITTEQRSRKIITYRVSNLGDSAAVYIHSPKEAGWDLAVVPGGAVELADAWVVPVAAEPASTSDVKVVWEQRAKHTLAVDSEAADVALQVFLASDDVAPQLRADLEAVLKLRDGIREQRREAERLDALHKALSADQARVRENLNTLRKTTGNDALQRKLAQKLEEQERELSRLSGLRVQLSETIAE